MKGKAIMAMDDISVPLRAKIAKREKAIGCHITCNDPQQTEMLGDVGFDYFWIDLEHTVIDNYTLAMHLIAARATGTPSFVRIPWNDPVLAKPVLELGVQGLIFPMIQTAADAQRAIASCYYPPRGTRGFGPRRAVRYGFDPLDDYIANGGDRLLKLIQIETRASVDNLEAIAAVPGVDILVLGPMDLSAGYGKLGQLMDPEVQAVYREVVARGHAAGKPVLVSYGDYSRKNIQMWVDMGMDLVTVGTEMIFLMNGARDALAHARDAFSS